MFFRPSLEFVNETSMQAAGPPFGICRRGIDNQQHHLIRIVLQKGFELRLQLSKSGELIGFIKVWSTVADQAQKLSVWCGHETCLQDNHHRVSIFEITLIGFASRE